MISGARPDQHTWLRRLVARAQAARLTAFVVPGLEIARAYGLDLRAAGLAVVATPRHACVLVLVGELPAGLARAAAVAYAQMPRPRALLAVGTGAVASLPEPDVLVPAEQAALASGVAALRRRVADGSFSPDAREFDVAGLRTVTEYVCPMHPDVVRSQPGSCPGCGMDLVPREAAAPTTEQAATPHAHDHIRPEAADSRAAEYTCPMHPDVVQGQPGACPVCGMHLVAREPAPEPARGETAYTCPMHPEVRRTEPGPCPVCGMKLEPRERDTARPRASAHPDGATEMQQHGPGEEHIVGHHRPGGEMEHHAAGQAGAGHEEPTGDRLAQGGQGDAPQSRHAAAGGHPSAMGGEHAGHVAGQPGVSAGPMDHTAHGGAEHADMKHGAHGTDHMGMGGGGFMSMVMMTKDLPRSADGLPMEWLDVPFGPLFPGLPGGLALTLTLDGDTVARAKLEPGMLWRNLQARWPGPVDGFVERFAQLDPLGPDAYGALAERALQAAGSTQLDPIGRRQRVGVLERERAASHLGWLASFAFLLGDRWLAERAAALRHQLSQAGEPIALRRVREEARALVRQVDRTPLLARRLRGVGVLDQPRLAELDGPVSRAAGLARDARVEDAAYQELGFRPLALEGGDALARLRLRLAELEQSLDLLLASPAEEVRSGVHPPASGTGQATVETPRGAATLRIHLDGGQVAHAEVWSPSQRLAELVRPVAEGRELADALLGIASLDLSPWELDR